MEHEHSHDHAYLHEHNIPHLHHETDTHDEAHNHTHSHDAANGHGHVHENTQAVLNRLSRAIGHLESVRKMVARRPGLQRGPHPDRRRARSDHEHRQGDPAGPHPALHRRRCRARRRAGPRRAVSGDRQVCEITKAPPGLSHEAASPKHKGAASRRDSPALIFMELLCGSPARVYIQRLERRIRRSFANCCP